MYPPKAVSVTMSPDPAPSYFINPEVCKMPVFLTSHSRVLQQQHCVEFCTGILAVPLAAATLLCIIIDCPPRVGLEPVQLDHNSRQPPALH